MPRLKTPKNARKTPKNARKTPENAQTQNAQERPRTPKNARECKVLILRTPEDVQHRTLYLLYISNKKAGQLEKHAMDKKTCKRGGIKGWGVGGVGEPHKIGLTIALALWIGSDG